MAFEIKNAAGARLETGLGSIHLTTLLGKGKSGYSYLGRNQDSEVIVKLVHDEPCPYYDFGDGNKTDIEVQAYYLLKDLGLRIPELLCYDLERRFIVKEYIQGMVATELIADGRADQVVEQLYNMSKIVKNAGINLDYFPANFVVKKGILYYIDYEYNPYLVEWDLEHWGIYYWANSEGMNKFLNTGDITALNQSADSGIPIKHSLEALVDDWNNRYD
ncbi:MAG: hypothetical protein JXA42_12355 [Anaerolineales bacterium]|nr:hypothetical protein [Anaerolineales bacterium]